MAPLRKSIGLAVLLFTSLMLAIPEQAAAPGLWTTTWIDSPIELNHQWNSSWRSLAVAVSPSGATHMMHYDDATGMVKHAWWDGGSWRIETVDGLYQYSKHVSLAMDSYGRPHAVYVNGSNVLTYAWRSSSTWNIQRVDTNISEYPALALDKANRPHVVYHGQSRWDLIHAVLEGGQWNRTVVDWNPSEDVGNYPSIVIDDQDRVRISYHVRLSWLIRYAEWDGNTWVKEFVSGGVVSEPGHSSIALDPAGLPAVALHPPYGGLYLARRINGTWVTDLVDNETGAGLFPTLRFDSVGRPMIAYHGGGDLRLARLLGTSWVVETVHGAGFSGYHASMGMFAGQPVIGFYDGTNRRVGLATGFMDDSPPSSRLDPTPGLATNVPVALHAVANDSESTVSNVTLAYRFGPDDSSLGPWMNYSLAEETPYEFNFSFPGGEGVYEFATTATDAAGNSEGWPGTLGTHVVYDQTPPSSSLNDTTYWAEGPAIIAGEAHDIGAGVLSTSLSYRYSPDNHTWTDWTFFETVIGSPPAWVFTFPSGEGSYQLKTASRDLAGNREPDNAGPALQLGYDVTVPDSPPTLIVDVASGGSHELFWTPSSSPDVLGYNIYRGTTPGGPYERLASVPSSATHFTDTQQGGDARYYYTLTAFDRAGHESGYSTEESADPGSELAQWLVPVLAVLAVLLVGIGVWTWKHRRRAR